MKILLELRIIKVMLLNIFCNKIPKGGCGECKGCCYKGGTRTIPFTLIDNNAVSIMIAAQQE